VLNIRESKPAKVIGELGCTLVVIWIVHYNIVINVDPHAVINLGLGLIFYVIFPFVMTFVSAAFIAVLVFWMLNRSLPGRVPGTVY
jgi:hypothetical protein